MRTKYASKPLCVLLSIALIAAFILVPSASFPDKAYAATEVKDLSKLNMVYDNFNTLGVTQGEPYYYVFTVPSGKKLKITAILLYHYYYGYGPDGGDIIIIRDDESKVGSWTGITDREPHYYLEAYPDITLGEGKYYVYCSNYDTWSYNADSGGEGFTQIYGTLSDAGSKPSKGVVSKIANVKGAKAKVTVKKVSKATKYQIRYKVGSDTKWTTVKKSSKNTFTIKVAKGKKVKVQARVTNKNGTGSWGKTKSFKTDKK